LGKVDENAFYIDVKDFLGNRIICCRERWDDHIANDLRNHNLEGLEKEVIRALTKPSGGMRHHDTDFPERMSYYGRSSIARYIKVSVEFNDRKCIGTGRIITAYACSKMKPNEQPEF